MNMCFLADARAEHTRRWTKYFALKGHRVDLITLNPQTLDDYEPVHLHVIQKSHPSSNLLSRLRNLPFVLATIKRIMREHHPDILHAHSSEGYAWLARFTGFHPYVVTPWGTDILIEAKKVPWNRLLTSWALRHADLLTCDAHHMKDELIHLGTRAERIQIVIFGVDLRRFTPCTQQNRELRHRYTLGDARIVISTRTLTPIHDVETFVRAIPLITRAVPDVKFVIVGDGPDRGKLESLVEALGIRDVVWFVGYVSEDEMVGWLHTADVYVSTSLTDAGLASSTAEAMACELPVVATDNGDNREWIAEGVGGFLVPNGAYEAIADRVVRLLQNTEMRRQYGRYNRQVIEQRNNSVTEMDRMEVMYEHLARCTRHVR